jgi:hypothetical protein
MSEKQLGTVNAVCARSKAAKGWFCTREAGHPGPCAAIVDPRMHEDTIMSLKKQNERMRLELRFHGVSISFAHTICVYCGTKSPHNMHVPRLRDGHVHAPDCVLALPEI